MYAGFWKRFGAYGLDYVILNILTMVILLFAAGLTIVLELAVGADEAGAVVDFVATWIAVPLILFGPWLYFALFESSRLRATPGKMILGLVVADEWNGRISFPRATARYFSKLISAIPFCAGFVMAAFLPRKRALHDVICGTLVLIKDEVRGAYFSRAGTNL